MSQETNDMRPEYDIRGGIRGKYLERYTQGTQVIVHITFNSPFVANSTASSESIGKVTRPASYPAFYPSPMIQMGSSLTTVHAGQDTPRE